MTRAGWRLALLAGVGLLAVPVRAEPWWLAWEGETWPEDSGWLRTTYGGGDERSLHDGVMTLDGRASIDSSDFYRTYHSLSLDPGQTFVMEWRLRVLAVSGFADPGVSALSEGNGVVFLWYTENSIYSMLEGEWVPFVPGVFHDYWLMSTDMRNYTLLIDSQPAYQGQFVSSGGPSEVDWGDVTQGASSLSDWDYFRVGIVPEAPTGLLVGFVGLVGTVLRSRREGMICDRQTRGEQPKGRGVNRPRVTCSLPDQEDLTCGLFGP